MCTFTMSRDVIDVEGRAPVAVMDRLEKYARAGDEMRFLLCQNRAIVDDMCSMKSTHYPKRKRCYIFEIKSNDAIYEGVYYLNWDNWALPHSKRPGLSLWCMLDSAVCSDAPLSQCRMIARRCVGEHKTGCVTELVSTNRYTEPREADFTRAIPISPPPIRLSAASKVVTFGDLEIIDRFCERYEAWVATAVDLIETSAYNVCKTDLRKHQRKHLALLGKLRGVIKVQAAGYAMHALKTAGMPEQCSGIIEKYVRH